MSTWSEDASRPDWDLIIGYILQRLPQGGRALDFGCYTGGLLSRLGSSYERYGVEINNTAAAIASDRNLVQVWPSIDDIPNEVRFDVIIASDVIEHMRDPGDLIDSLATLLANDGILIITTGDADNRLWSRFGANWWYCFYPEHISFISKAWLGHFTHSRDLSIEHCDRFRYSRFSSTHLFFIALLTYAYGYFPSTYLRLFNMLRSMLNRPRQISVPGNGISADHLFVVLARKRTTP